MKNCRECGSSFLGQEIPEEHRHMYGGETNFSRIIGIAIRGVYDGVLIWACPDCGHQWPRFPEGDRRHDKAVELIESARRGMDAKS